MKAYNEIIEMLIGRLEEMRDRYQDRYGLYSDNVDYGKTIGLNDAISIVNQLAEEYKNGWIPCTERYPNTDSYILLSFANFSIPLVDRYEEDENGGAFYIGDEEETCTMQDMIVNAWQPLPVVYREEDE